MYFKGKWAYETVHMISDDAFKKTFGETDKHEVFIIEKIFQVKNG
jgi:serine protease inhibitor